MHMSPYLLPLASPSHPPSLSFFLIPLLSKCIFIHLSSSTQFYNPSFLPLCSCLLNQIEKNTVTNKNIFVISFFKILFLKIYLFIIYFWLHWIFVAVCGLSLVAAREGYSSLWCTSVSLQWLLLLRNTGSKHAGFSSCGTWAQ